MDKKYDAEVTLEYKFKIIVGSDALSESFMEEFREYFYDFYTVEDHVRHIAQYVARFGTVRGMDGYPYLIEDGRDDKYNKVSDDFLKKCINVVGYFDEDEVEVYLSRWE